MGNLEAAGLPSNPRNDPQARIPQFPYELPSAPSIPVPLQPNGINACTKEQLVLAFHRGQRRMLTKLLSQQTFLSELEEIEVDSSYLDGLRVAPGGTKALVERLGLRFHEE